MCSLSEPSKNADNNNTFVTRVGPQFACFVGYFSGIVVLDVRIELLICSESSCSWLKPGGYAAVILSVAVVILLG